MFCDHERYSLIIKHILETRNINIDSKYDISQFIIDLYYGTITVNTAELAEWSKFAIDNYDNKIIYKLLFHLLLKVHDTCMFLANENHDLMEIIKIKVMNRILSIDCFRKSEIFEHFNTSIGQEKKYYHNGLFVPYAQHYKWYGESSNIIMAYEPLIAEMNEGFLDYILSLCSRFTKMNDLTVGYNKEYMSCRKNIIDIIVYIAGKNTYESHKDNLKLVKLYTNALQLYTHGICTIATCSFNMIPKEYVNFANTISLPDITLLTESYIYYFDKYLNSEEISSSDLSKNKNADISCILFMYDTLIHFYSDLKKNNITNQFTTDMEKYYYSPIGECIDRSDRDDCKTYLYFGTRVIRFCKKILLTNKQEYYYICGPLIRSIYDNHTNGYWKQLTNSNIINGTLELFMIYIAVMPKEDMENVFMSSNEIDKMYNQYDILKFYLMSCTKYIQNINEDFLCKVIYKMYLSFTIYIAKLTQPFARWIEPITVCSILERMLLLLFNNILCMNLLLEAYSTKNNLAKLASECGLSKLLSNMLNTIVIYFESDDEIFDLVYGERRSRLQLCNNMLIQVIQIIDHIIDVIPDEFVEYISYNKDNVIKCIRDNNIQTNITKYLSEHEKNTTIFPDDRYDPITHELIKFPVMIPGCELIFNKSTIFLSILNNSENPYTRQSLTIEIFNDYNNEPEVIEKINIFKEKAT